MHKRWLRVAGMALAVLAAGAQFVRPDRTNPAGDPAHSLQARVAVTPEVERILARACNDCHSNQTRWPWYSHVAPASWLVIDHVNHGRSHLNFSHWGALDSAEQAEMLAHICKLATSGDMPLPSYLWMHRNARLSPDDVRALCQWSQAERYRLAPAR